MKKKKPVRPKRPASRKVVEQATLGTLASSLSAILERLNAPTERERQLEGRLGDLQQLLDQAERNAYDENGDSYKELYEKANKLITAYAHEVVELHQVVRQKEDRIGLLFHEKQEAEEKNRKLMEKVGDVRQEEIESSSQVESLQNIVADLRKRNDALTQVNDALKRDLSGLYRPAIYNAKAQQLILSGRELAAVEKLDRLDMFAASALAGSNQSGSKAVEAELAYDFAYAMETERADRLTRADMTDHSEANP